MRLLGLTLGNWRLESTRSCGLLAAAAGEPRPGIYLLSARTCGLKGLIPGSRHSWLSAFDGARWHTVEISDEETLSLQYGVDGRRARWKHFGLPCKANRFRAPFISNREPDGCWFGQPARLEWHCSDPGLTASFCRRLDEVCQAYAFRNVFSLTDNNCSKFASYLLWRAGIRNCRALRRPQSALIGFRASGYWDSLYPALHERAQTGPCLQSCAGQRHAGQAPLQAHLAQHVADAVDEPDSVVL